MSHIFARMKSFRRNIQCTLTLPIVVRSFTSVCRSFCREVIFAARQLDLRNETLAKTFRIRQMNRVVEDDL